MATLTENMKPAFQPGQSFFTMFALFFPAVTGIMAGANMSGDLKNPAKSLPIGTMTAIAVTGAVYLVMAVLFGGTRPQSELVANNFIIGDIAWSVGLINAGCSPPRSRPRWAA